MYKINKKQRTYQKTDKFVKQLIKLKYTVTI